MVIQSAAAQAYALTPSHYQRHNVLTGRNRLRQSHRQNRNCALLEIREYSVLVEIDSLDKARELFIADPKP